MYAPIDFDRSLYLFCCNNRACSVLSSGWTVIRNQSSEAATAAITAKETNLLNSSASTANVGLPVAAPSVWGSLLDEEDDVDMMMLLAARDASLAVKKEAVAPISRKEKSVLAIQQNSTQSPLLVQALTCWKVDAISDPCPYGADVLIYDSHHGEGDEEVEEYSALTSDAVEQAHRMLAGYIAAAEAEEGGDDDQGRDDPALLDLLKKEMLSSARADKSRERISSTTVKPSREGSDKNSVEVVKHSSSKGEKKEKTTLSGKEEDTETTIFAKSDRKCRVENLFQAAVSHAPTQVVRFAYGGYPLWCTHPPPIVTSSSVPRCVCGEERVFEMQLMPGALRTRSCSTKTNTNTSISVLHNTT